MKKGTLYYEKACSIVSLETAVAEDAVVQSQLLLTQGLLLFSTEQVGGCIAVCCCCSSIIPLSVMIPTLIFIYIYIYIYVFFLVF